MKIEKLIKLTLNFAQDLEDAKTKYKELHGKSPCVFTIYEDDGILLCFDEIKEGCSRKAVKPYMKISKFKYFAKMIKDSDFY